MKISVCWRTKNWSNLWRFNSSPFHLRWHRTMIVHRPQSVLVSEQPMNHKQQVVWSSSHLYLLTGLDGCDPIHIWCHYLPKSPTNLDFALKEKTTSYWRKIPMWLEWIFTWDYGISYSRFRKWSRCLFMQRFFTNSNFWNEKLLPNNRKISSQWKRTYWAKSISAHLVFDQTNHYSHNPTKEWFHFLLWSLLVSLSLFVKRTWVVDCFEWNFVQHEWRYSTCGTTPICICRGTRGDCQCPANMRTLLNSIDIKIEKIFVEIDIV